MMDFPVTISLIAANVLVSLIGLSNRDFFEDNNFWIAPIRDGRQWWRFVTSAFLHVIATHLLITMFVLWEFGRVLERSLGTARDKDSILAAFEAHEAAVRAAIPAERLLVHSAKEGWAPLCGFLGVPVPDAPYPRTNSKEEFFEHMKKADDL